MTRHVVVSSNCQTGGIVGCLREFFPQDHFVGMPLPWPLGGEQQLGQFAQQLEGYDFWVSIAPDHICTQVLERISGHCPEVIRIPAIGFSAFHPDLCYAQDAASGAMTQHHYNSAIGVWCYQQALSPDEAAMLFNGEVYARLGYLDQWASGRSFMQQVFASADLEADFEPFFRSIQRSGCFMHSINHPTIFVLGQLSRIIATRLGAHPERVQRPLSVRDALSDTVWPLYPEVADALSLPGGSLIWKLGPNHWQEGVRNYLAFCFEDYRKQGISPANIRILHRDQALLDRVLGEARGAMA